MGIPLKVPMAVHNGRFLCIRGQIDVNAQAQACNPADILAQTRACARHILSTLDAAASDGPWVPRLLAVYAVPSPDHDVSAIEALLRDMLPGGATLPIAIVPIPWLYYPGIDIEIDLIASRDNRANCETFALQDFEGFASHGSDITFLAGTVSPAADLQTVCDALLGALPPDARLQVFIQAGSRTEFEAALPARNGTAEFLPCIIPGQSERRIRVQAMAAQTTRRIVDQNGIIIRRFGEVAVLDASGIPQDPSASLDLPDQTEDMMQRSQAALASVSMDFGHVLKGTVFYVGNDTDEALYSNLRVRDGYYSHPGPASTGVPFAELAEAGSMIRMSLFLSMHHGDPS